MTYLKYQILIFAALVSICSTTQAQIDWTRTQSEKSKISFELPEKPTVQNQDLNGIKSEIFSYRDAANIYGVVASDFSGINVDFNHSDPSEYYKQMKEGSLLCSNAILVSEQSVAYKKMLGKEIIYTIMAGNHEFTYFKRFFFRGHFIYQITIGGSTRMKQLLLDKKQLFFNSIQFE